MPILPPLAGKFPFDTVDYVMQLARPRMLDAIDGTQGDVTNYDQPYVQPAFYGAFRRLQEALANAGAAAFESEAIVGNIPAVSTADPAIQVSLSYVQFFDGTNYWPNVYLPQDMILPLRLWERQSGSGSYPIPMKRCDDGLPDGVKSLRLRLWEWRQNTIFMPGATMVNDLRIRYAAYLPDPATQGNVLWYMQPVPIIRCANALAWFICSEICNARGDMDGNSFDAKAMAAVSQMLNRESRQKQRGSHRRQPYSRRVHTGWGINC